jgi:phosphoglycolate phosphatase-like HAD superfamily hydrolase
MKILLFDIDGTLIRTAGAGKRAMEAALSGAFGVTEIRDVVPYSGRTDPAIGLDLLRAHNLPDTSENLERLTHAYLDALPHALTEHPGEILPNVVPLLETFKQRTDVMLGLLTGNVQRGAHAKLSHYRLWDYFPHGGGFGDGRENRNDVAHAAWKHAEAQLNRTIHPNSIWVIGDTPHDISCARHIGAKVLAVATGWDPLHALAPHAPDLAVETLADPRAMDALLS